MTAKQIKQQTDRTWDFLVLLATGIGGAMHAFSQTYQLGYFLDRDWYFSQFIGAILITMFCYRVWTLHNNELK